MVILSLKRKVYHQNKTVAGLKSENTQLRKQIAVLKQSGQEIERERASESNPLKRLP
jgi:cell division protein FtsB